MIKLLVLALALAALVAFTTAHTTIVTTTIKDEISVIPGMIPFSQVDVCKLYLEQQSIQSSPHDQNYQPTQTVQQLCCRQLLNMDELSLCKALKELFQGALQMQGQEGGHELMQKAQQLPQQCNLQITRRECELGGVDQTVITTVVTNDQDDDFSRQSSSRGSQQCSEVQGRQFNKCQRYIQQQQQQGGSLLLRFNRQQGQQQQQEELRSCCNELENVQRECHCDAVQEVYEQALRQQQQQGRKQSGAESEMVVQTAIQNLKNECNLQVHQCKIPSSMF